MTARRPAPLLAALAATLLPALPLLAPPEAAAAAPAAAPRPAAVPQAYVAEYEVLRNGSAMGRSTVRLQRVDAGSWELVSETEGTSGMAALAGVSIREHSRLAIADGRASTLGYDYRQRAAMRTRERSLVLDPARGIVRSRDRDATVELPLSAGLLDRQGVLVGLMLDAAAGRRGTLEYTVADRSAVEVHRYRTVAEEAVTVPAGARRALRVERVREGGAGRSTTTWLSPSDGWVPVRILQIEDDGERLESRLVRLTRPG